MRILVDMDDTLCDWMGASTARITELGYPVSKDPHAYPVSIVLSKDYGLRATTLLYRAMREPGFFINLQPHKEAVEMVCCLDSLGFDVCICTMPLPYDKEDWCKEEKRAWVANHLGYKFVDKMIFSSRKYEVAGLYLIDDSPATVHYAETHNPQWKPVLVNHFYNKDLFCERRVSLETMQRDMLEILNRDGILPSDSATLTPSISELQFTLAQETIA